MQPLPPSGVWRGQSTRVSLAHQGKCGERIEGKSFDTKPIMVVLFFDENSLYGHGTTEGQALTINGWWGSITKMRPLVEELAESELWEQGEAGLSFILRDGSREEACYGWIREGEIFGYRRYEGG